MSPAVMIGEDELLFCGGPNGSRVFTLNLNTFVVTSRKQMLLDRQGHSLILYKNKVFALGGYSTLHGTTLAQCEVYDIYLDKWTPIKEMNYRRRSFGSCLLQTESANQRPFCLRRQRRLLLRPLHRVLSDCRGPLDRPEHQVGLPLHRLPLFQCAAPDHHYPRVQVTSPAVTINRLNWCPWTSTG